MLTSRIYHVFPYVLTRRASAKGFRAFAYLPRGVLDRFFGAIVQVRRLRGFNRYPTTIRLMFRHRLKGEALFGHFLHGRLVSTALGRLSKGR